jgi:hypothetical protein
MQKVADALDLVRAKMMADARRAAGEDLADDDETSDGATAQAS